MMKRRDLLKAIAAGTIASLTAPRLNAANRSPKKRPNVLYIVVHDLGRYFSPYGVNIDTPNLQAFASEGITLENASCACPPCSPSRGCAVTGMYAHNNGLAGLVNHGWSLPVDCRTTVDYFNDAGYETAWAGFQHERLDPKENRYQVNLPHRQGKEDTDVFIENAVDDAIEYLTNKRDKSKPFYLNIGTQEAHGSLWAPDGYYPKIFDRPKKLYGIDNLDDVLIPAQIPDNHHSRVMFSRFVPCIRYMDRQFGRLMAAVKKLGLEENTLVVFTTDHGVMGSRAKGTAYERGMEIGTIFRLPGVIQPSERMREVVNNIDFLPTLLDATGIAYSPEKIQGRSFWPRISGGEWTAPEAIYTERLWHENYDPVRTVRTERYHYLRNLLPAPKKFMLPHEILASPNPKVRATWPNHYIFASDLTQPDHPRLAMFGTRPHEELYDLHNDPEEFVNLADDPAHAALKKKLSAMCDTWMTETKDPGLAGLKPPAQQVRNLAKWMKEPNILEN